VRPLRPVGPLWEQAVMDQVSRRWLALAVIATVALVYLYPLTLSTPLLDPDEGLHASIAQEMVERGDYVIPRFCGEPFRDKPIVYFLAQAGSLQLFGMHEWAVRLPGVLFSLLGSFTTAALAWRFYDKEIASYALIASLTLVLPVMLTQSPAHDIALVPVINLLAICFWEQERAGTTRRLWCLLIGGAVCVALSLLTKGLIGIAVFAVGIGLYAIATKSVSWRLAGRSAFVLGCGAILASPWFLAMEAASPGYLNYYFVHRHLLGFATEAQTHGKAPWYYYAAPVLGGAMPWLL
jgi:4-amino-4-deoxy-L-arabinose transferase-like glycosyltransferase